MLYLNTSQKIPDQNLRSKNKYFMGELKTSKVRVSKQAKFLIRLVFIIFTIVTPGQFVEITSLFITLSQISVEFKITPGILFLPIR